MVSFDVAAGNKIIHAKTQSPQDSKNPDHGVFVCCINFFLGTLGGIKINHNGEVYETLQEDDHQRVAKKYFLDKLRPDFHDRTEKQLDRAINWGHFAELFAYDNETDELFLE